MSLIRNTHDGIVTKTVCVDYLKLSELMWMQFKNIDEPVD